MSSLRPVSGTPIGAMMSHMTFRAQPIVPTGIDSETENAVKQFRQKLLGRYDLAAAIVFGSRARRTQRPDSDADLALILRGSKEPFWQTTLALSDLAYDVLLETGILIQPLPIWEDDWNHPEQSASPGLLRSISQEGIRV